MNPRAKRALKKTLLPPYEFLTRSFFNPILVLNKCRALPYFARNLSLYKRLNRRETFQIRLRNLWYRSYDRFDTAGSLTFHYFYQDLWAAQRLYDSGTKDHVDIASRLDGFIAHVLPFCRVTYVDIRPTQLDWLNFTFRRGSITEMPFENESVESLSSLHVFEHVGLGRYGDPVDPEGYLRAGEELTRVLKPGGTLLLTTPVGKEALYFDAHRVFDPHTVRNAFGKLDLIDFALINDRNEFVPNATLEDGSRCAQGCGLFVFTKAKKTV